MRCHKPNYTYLHENVNANMYLTPIYADSHTCVMDCIDWINTKIANKTVTQESLCEAMKKQGFAITQPTLSRILDRKTQDPSYKRVNAIIRACGGDPDLWMGCSSKTNNITNLPVVQHPAIIDEVISMMMKTDDIGRARIAERAMSLMEQYPLSKQAKLSQ